MRRGATSAKVDRTSTTNGAILSRSPGEKSDAACILRRCSTSHLPCASRSRLLFSSILFRGGLAERPLVAGFDPVDPAVDAVAALASDPATAAAAVHHADEDALGGIITELATRASVQRDAHLVKYTLACFDAAHDDPTEQRLFLTAAASLVAWWAQAGDPDDPLTGGD